MSGLVLKLAPKERVLINGAVIENGERRIRLSIRSPNAFILRLKDAIHPDQVTTPVRRVCYALQLVLSGDAKADDMKLQILRGIEQLSQVLRDADSRAALQSATGHMLDQNYYQALKSLRALLPREERLLATAT